MASRPHRRDRFWRGLVLSAAITLGSSPAVAQVPIPQADPQDVGLELPTTGPVRQGEGRTAEVTSKGGKTIVGQVLVDIADRRLLILPNGRLVSLPIDDTKPTDKPFEPATFDEVTEELMAVFKGFKTRKTARFLYIYNTSEGFYTATSRILETMFPGVLAYFERQKLDVHEPPMPLVVIMFKTEKEFQQYQEMPPGVAAYYSQVSNRIVLYEQSDLVDLAPELAVKQSISTIAHEGVHQILFNIGVQQRMTRWPMWISEGLPEYFAPTSTDRRLRWKGVGQVNDMRMYELSEYLKTRATSTPGDLVRRAVEPAGFGSLEYAISWGLTHFLATRQKEKFLEYLVEVSRMKPFDNIDLGSSTASTATHTALFTRHFGSDFAKLEEGLIKHLQSLPYTNPIENQTHYVAMFAIESGGRVSRMAGVTTSPAGVRKWQEEAMMQVPPELRPRLGLQVRTFPNRVLAEKFAEQFLGGR